MLHWSEESRSTFDTKYQRVQVFVPYDLKQMTAELETEADCSGTEHTGLIDIPLTLINKHNLRMLLLVDICCRLGNWERIKR